MKASPTSGEQPMYHSPAVFAPFSQLIAAESTRHGGVSPMPYTSLNLGISTADAPENVSENRSRFWQAMRVDPRQVATSHQIHGSQVLPVTQPGHYEGYDALITNRAGIVLAVTIADCTPVLIFDPVHRAVAAIHAGWRGTVQNIVVKTLDRMQQDFGTLPNECYAYIGTCIDECSFEVDYDVAEQFSDAYRRFEPATGKYLVNLKKANLDQLSARGMASSRIQVSPFSTVLHNQDFFSYRHEGGQTGRMLACIGIV